MLDRKEWVSGATPVGTFVFPRVNEPDYKFKEEGEYSVKLQLTEDEGASELRETIEEFHKLALAAEKKGKGKKRLKQADLPFKQAEDRASGELIAGVWNFNCKRKAAGKTKAGKKWSAKVDLFDAKGARLTEEIWGGTRGRIAYTLKPWYSDGLGFGISILLNACKVIDLVTRGERNAETYGFGEEEEGFSSAGPQTDDGNEPPPAGDGDAPGSHEF
jgi:hypothetical protein